MTTTREQLTNDQRAQYDEMSAETYSLMEQVTDLFEQHTVPVCMGVLVALIDNCIGISEDPERELFKRHLQKVMEKP